MGPARRSSRASVRMKGMTKEKERRSFGVGMADLRVDLGVEAHLMGRGIGQYNDATGSKARVMCGRKPVRWVLPRARHSSPTRVISSVARNRTANTFAQPCSFTSSQVRLGDFMSGSR